MDLPENWGTAGVAHVCTQVSNPLLNHVNHFHAVNLRNFDVFGEAASSRHGNQIGGVLA